MIKELKAEIAEKFSALIISAFGLVAALAWNDAVKAIFRRYATNGEAIFPMVIYAFIVTIVAVILTLWIARVSQKIKK